MAWSRSFRSDVRRLAGLPAPEVAVIASAGALLPIAVVALRALGLARAERVINTIAWPTPASVPPVRLAALVDIAARRLPLDAACLARSITLTALLLRTGRPAGLRLGVRGSGAGFEAHAWVELDGAVLNDSPDVRERWNVILDPRTG